MIIIQVIIVSLLSLFILIQKTGTDGLSGLSGGSSNFGTVPKRRKGDFLTKTTMFLAILFMLNSIIIAKVFISEIHESKKITDGIDDKIVELQPGDQAQSSGSTPAQVPKAE